MILAGVWLFGPDELDGRRVVDPLRAVQGGCGPPGDHAVCALTTATPPGAAVASRRHCIAWHVDVGIDRSVVPAKLTPRDDAALRPPR